MTRQEHALAGAAVQVDGRSVRVRPGPRGTTVVTVPFDQPAATPALVAGVVAAAGRAPLRTSAMRREVADPFLAEGFAIHDELVLLSLTLPARTGPPPAPPAGIVPPPASLALRPAGRRPWPALAAVDRDAFGPEHALAAEELAAAAAATDRARVRAAGAPASPVVGFAVTGQSRADGFLQRLAVAPGARRLGVARALVADALRWCWALGAERVWVNTSTTNAAALALYQAAGFSVRPERLVVLAREATT